MKASPKHLKLFLYMITTLLVLVMMSYFGFRLKGFRFHNQVQLATPGIEIGFGRYAVAYTQSFFSDVGDGMTMELDIEPWRSDLSGFRTLLLIHDGNDGDQLIVGQWRSSLIIMNGDDYSHQRRLPRMIVPLNNRADGRQLVSIVSNSSGTMAYHNGKLVKENRGLVLRYPKQMDQSRLIVANNLQGDQPWSGIIAGLALYNQPLDAGSIIRHHQAWSHGRDFSVFKSEAPKLLYAFNQKHLNRVTDLMESDIDLLVPKYFKVIKKNMLSWPEIQRSQQSNLVKDIIINLLGFIPLGILLAGTLTQLGRFGANAIWVSVILVSFSFSLLIEVVQIWLPSRDSSSLDLILNSLGGWIGSLLYMMVCTKKNSTMKHQIG